MDLPHYRSVAALREAVAPEQFYVKYETMSVLCWDLGLGPLPSLKMGQHCQVALIRKNKILQPYQAKVEIDEGNKVVSGPPTQLIA
jgi:hypothetical protein